jgi:hypothetical protein
VNRIEAKIVEKNELYDTTVYQQYFDVDYTWADPFPAIVSNSIYKTVTRISINKTLPHYQALYDQLFESGAKQVLLFDCTMVEPKLTIGEGIPLKAAQQVLRIVYLNEPSMRRVHIKRQPPESRLDYRNVIYIGGCSNRRLPVIDDATIEQALDPDIDLSEFHRIIDQYNAKKKAVKY